ncbi:MAG: hypothetical protein WBW89_02325, partial [Candidatus Cybelea sp.]
MTIARYDLVEVVAALQHAARPIGYRGSEGSVSFSEPRLLTNRIGVHLAAENAGRFVANANPIFGRYISECYWVKAVPDGDRLRDKGNALRSLGRFHGSGG